MISETVTKMRREPAAIALAAGCTITDAAAASGVSDRTVKRWLTSPKFRRRVERHRSAATVVALGKLSHSLAAAVDRLVALLDSLDPRIAATAAQALLRFALPYSEQEDLAEQVAELRRRVAVEPAH